MHLLYPASWSGTSAPALWVPTQADLTRWGQQIYASVNGDAGGTWAPTAPMDIGGLGVRARLRYDLISDHPNADTLFAITTTREIVCSATLTASRIATLSATGALIGDVMTIYADASMSTSYLVTVKSDTGAALLTIGNNASADSKWGTFQFNGTHWVNLASCRVSNRIVQTLSQRSPFEQTTTSTTFVDADSAHVSTTFAAVAGDLLEVYLSGTIGTQDATAGITVTLGLTVVDGGPPSVVASACSFSEASALTTWNTGYGVVSLAHVYTVATTGNVTVKPQLKTSNASHAAFVDGDNGIGSRTCSPLTMVVKQIRP